MRETRRMLLNTILIVFKVLIALAVSGKDFFVLFVRADSYKLVEVNRLSLVIMLLTSCHINPRA